MKKLVVFAVILFAASLFAQEAKVPANVKAKFKALYPHAENVKWDVEEGNYEVSFEAEEDVDMSLLFNSKGEILETETEIEKEDLPAAVLKTLKTDFAGWDIEEAAKIVRDGKTTFEAELEKGETKIDAIFNAEGKLIKKVKKEENDEENEKAKKGEKDEKDEDGEN